MYLEGSSLKLEAYYPFGKERSNCKLGLYFVDETSKQLFDSVSTEASL